MRSETQRFQFCTRSLILLVAWGAVFLSVVRTGGVTWPTLICLCFLGSRIGRRRGHGILGGTIAGTCVAVFDVRPDLLEPFPCLDGSLGPVTLDMIIGFFVGALTDTFTDLVVRVRNTPPVR